jgi:hypothetical protein
MQELIKILEQILNDSKHRKDSIKDLQNKIWNEEFTASAEVAEIYRALALDLDYYEPSIELRKESSSYYGDDTLIEEVTQAISKIKKHT